MKKIRFRGKLYNVVIYPRKRKKGLVANLTQRARGDKK